MKFLRLTKNFLCLGLLLVMVCSCQVDANSGNKRPKLLGKFSGLVGPKKIKLYLYQNGYYTINEQEAVSRLNNTITSYKWQPLTDNNLLQLYKTNGEKHSIVKLIDSSKAEIQLNNQTSSYILLNIQ